MTDEPGPTTDWRDDPGWKLTAYAPELWSEADAPDRPTAEAELAQPPVWASLYVDGKMVATWRRPRVVVGEPPNGG